MSDDEAHKSKDAPEITAADLLGGTGGDDGETTARPTPTNEDGSLIDAFTAGGRLRSAREAQGRSLEDMSRELRINWRVLEALEKTIQPPDHDMRRTRIVARSYASALGIDPEPVLADFPVEEKIDLATAIPKSSVTVSERRQRNYLVPAMAMASLVIGVGLAVVVFTPKESAEVRTAAQAPSIAERVVAVNTAQESLFAREPLKQTATKKVDLSIVALRPAWIEVRGADGTIFRSRTMARDETYYPRVGAGWTVTVQDGSAFEWRVDDVPVGLLAETEQPVYSASIDEAAVTAEEFAAPAMAATSNSRPAR